MKRLVMPIGVVALVVHLSGCPPTTPETSPLVGVWTLMVPGLETTLTLNADGTATATPFSAPSGEKIPGTLTWENNGTEFLMRNTIGQAQNLYVGRAIDNNTLEGGWVQWVGGNRGDGGEWDAVRQ